MFIAGFSVLSAGGFFFFFLIAAFIFDTKGCRLSWQFLLSVLVNKHSLSDEKTEHLQTILIIKVDPITFDSFALVRKQKVVDVKKKKRYNR